MNLLRSHGLQHRFRDLESFNDSVTPTVNHGIGYVIGARGTFPEALVGTIEGMFMPRLRVVASKKPNYMLPISLGKRNW